MVVSTGRCSGRANEVTSGVWGAQLWHDTPYLAGLAKVYGASRYCSAQPDTPMNSFSVAWTPLLGL
jgi:hypothetical protein